MAVRVEQNAEPIPGYRLIERLGGGGFGEVWRAEAPGGLHKAIKFVYGDLSSAGDSDQRAKQELKAIDRVRTVRHPYILSLERYEVIDGQLIIVMELADRNLWDRYRECRTQGMPGLPREELLRYMEETAEALDLMNQEYQLQHLDIKPQNLFLVHNHVKVADFGLVKDLEGSQASVTGGLTPVYAAPETFDGKVSRFSDQYSLAIVFQEVLSGQRPFNGTNVRQLIMQHISAEPNLASLPAADKPIVRRALAKNPTDRFPSCREFVSALRATTLNTGTSSMNLASPSVLTGGALPTQGEVAAVTPSASSSGQTPVARPGTDSAQGQQSTKPLRPQELMPEPTLRFVSEMTGSGCLFPALVVALGQVGLGVMQKLRETLQQQVAPLTQMPQLRFLLIDTDSEVMRLATRGSPAASLSAGEVVLTQLNRPSHYLKPRDGKPAIESWLNTRMLYRIPRSQVTGGVRALGRLAFTDNYRVIARRLQLELEAILDPEALQTGSRNTGLEIRTNRPRVYVLCGLAGGTGSGMFIDLAYTLRSLLKQMGYEMPDVVGLFLLPPVDSSRSRTLPLGNTCAALTELNYFGSNETIFQARYHDRESAIQDPAPPFSRTIILPMPDESDEVGTRELADLCGQFLYRDLTTPLGKVADLGRAGAPSVPWESRGQFFNTFNLYTLSWPRHGLLQALALQLSQQIVQRWVSKESKTLRESLQQRIQDAWINKELGADHFIHRMQTEVVKALGKPPDSLVMAILEPLKAGSAQGESTGRSRLRNEPRVLDSEQVAEALNQIEKLIGRARDEQSQEEPQLMRCLRDAGEKLSNEWTQKLSEISVRLIEEPQFRLAGAEEAIRVLEAMIEQALQSHEPLVNELTEKARAAHLRLRAMAGAPLDPGQPRPSRISAVETIELLRTYPKLRFQSLVMQHLISAFIGLRGHLSDSLREMNFCRLRLADLQRMLDEHAALVLPSAGASRREESIGRKLFMAGCKNVDEAMKLYMNGITPEHILELDGRMEKMLRTHFTALVHVCLTNTNILKDVLLAMLGVAEEYASEHLPPISVPELFFEQFPDPHQVEEEIGVAYDEATPEISTARSPRGGAPVLDMFVLATPEDAAGQQLRKLVQEAYPREDIQFAGSDEDVLFYRERINLALEDLEHLGPTGRDAYAQMNAADHFTPHTRCDIDFKR
jgi:serine/threonine protein kinase